MTIAVAITTTIVISIVAATFITIIIAVITRAMATTIWLPDLA